jgi:hypothetical protein
MTRDQFAPESSKVRESKSTPVNSQSQQTHVPRYSLDLDDPASSPQKPVYSATLYGQGSPRLCTPQTRDRIYRRAGVISTLYTYCRHQYMLWGKEVRTNPENVAMTPSHKSTGDATLMAFFRYIAFGGPFLSKRVRAYSGGTPMMYARCVATMIC